MARYKSWSRLNEESNNLCNQLLRTEKQLDARKAEVEALKKENVRLSLEVQKLKSGSDGVFFKVAILRKGEGQKWEWMFDGQTFPSEDEARGQFALAFEGEKKSEIAKIRVYRYIRMIVREDTMD